MKFKKLRYVKNHVDVFLPEDHNNLLDNLKTAYNILQDKIPKVDPTIIDKIDELKNLISKMRYVKSGDFYYARDHNLFVDAFNKVADICETLKRLAFVPKETYSIVAKVKARVLASGVEKLPYTESYSLTTTPAAPSGTDPYDPTWCPPEGWDKVWHFEDPAELEDFANAGYKYAYVENHCLEFNPPSEDYGDAIRDNKTNVFYKRVAVAVKQIFVSGTPEMYYYGVEIRNYGSYVIFLSISETNPKYLVLHDANPRETDLVKAEFPNPMDYVVVVVDFEEVWARVYDKNRNLLAEIIPQWEGGRSTAVFLGETNNYVGDTREVSIDWVAIKYL